MLCKASDQLLLCQCLLQTSKEIQNENHPRDYKRVFHERYQTDNYRQTTDASDSRLMQIQNYKKLKDDKVKNVYLQYGCSSVYALTCWTKKMTMRS